MRNIHIENSYNIWQPAIMQQKIDQEVFSQTQQLNFAESYLNRSYRSMYIEWWLHNIGYYLTLPFKKLEAINIRFKHVDLEEHK